MHREISMKVTLDLINWLIKSFPDILTALFGTWQQPYQALVILFIIDLSLGIWRSLKSKKLNIKSLGKKTLIKLVSHCLLIIVANQIEQTIKSTDFRFINGYSLSIALTYLVVNEAISCLRNFEAISGRKIRLKSPVFLLEILGIKEKAPEKGKDTNEK